MKHDLYIKTGDRTWTLEDSGSLYALTRSTKGLRRPWKIMLGTIEVARGGARSNPSEEFPYVELDGNMSPKTVEKLKKLLEERLPDEYPIASHEGTDIARVMKKRKIKHYSTDGYGRRMYSISKKRMTTLVPSLLRSSNEEERTLGSDICTTLEIGVI